LSAELAQYVVDHGMPPDEIQAGLIAETRRVAGPRAGMQVSPDQGALLTFLVRLVGARRVVEVGTFTGYSALCLARGLSEDGQLICFDISEDWVSVGRPFWARAGVANRIEVRIGPASETVRRLPPEPVIDVAFIDADKGGYRLYYEELLRRLRPGGLLLIDNVLWSGRVIDPAANDPDTVAIRELNDAVASDERVDRVMLGIADGLTMVRKC
jgi:caffeoyl-CoA O-methyltransferase